MEGNSVDMNIQQPVVLYYTIRRLGLFLHIILLLEK